MMMSKVPYLKSIVLACAMFLHYWHEIILHDYTISAPVGCSLIHWGLRNNVFKTVIHRNLQLHGTNMLCLHRIRA